MKRGIIRGGTHWRLVDKSPTAQHVFSLILGFLAMVLSLLDAVVNVILLPYYYRTS
jgi:hypothetical protein